ncbi:MAG: HAD family hydrolase [Anaerolineae bacterium]|nr:HAD family hydrolase [Anaerolineae bacterium]
MKLTVLIDLDGTLLVNDINVFIRQYFYLLSHYLADLAPPNQIIQLILAASQAMVTKRTPQLTLEETFDHLFYPAIQQSKEALQQRIDHFYTTVFPNLKNITQVQPGAVELIEYLVDQGHQIIIATNPLVPYQATYQRLSWAGLPVEKYPFALITTYEYSHFAKPNPEYFMEILAQIGWHHTPVVMIGNSLNDDILPADAIGIPTYWVNETQIDLQEVLSPYASAGKIAGTIPWVDTICKANIQPQFDNAIATRAMLAATPAAIDTLMRKRNRQTPPLSETEHAQICSLLTQLVSSTEAFLLQKSIPITEIPSHTQTNLDQLLSDFIKMRASLVPWLDKTYIPDRPESMTASPQTMQSEFDYLVKIAQMDMQHIHKLHAFLSPNHKL